MRCGHAWGQPARTIICPACGSRSFHTEPDRPERRYVGIVPENDPMEQEVYIAIGTAFLMLPWRLDLRNHSPTGLSWGYFGSGPSQCALAILCDAVGVERAQPLYMDFKFERIGQLDRLHGWEMTHAEVVAWVEMKEAQQ